MRSTPIAASVLALWLGPAAALADPACDDGETRIFFCEIEEKELSVCQRPGARVRYRYGPPGRPELTIDSVAHLSSRAYPGGGETRLRFENEGHHYLVYDLVRSSGLDEATGHERIEDHAGVHVLRGREHLVTLVCTGPTDAAAGKVLLGRLASGEEEDFLDIE